MAEYRTFTFPSADGTHAVSAAVWLPEGEPKAILTITHGMVEHKERYDRFARLMTGRGFAVYAHDHLGHGDSVSSPEELGYVCEKNPSDLWVRDMDTMRRVAQERHPNLPCFMLGHSMGSFLLRKYLAEYAEGLAGAVIMGTGYNPPAAAVIGKFLCGVIAVFRGWHYRSAFVQGLTAGKSYEKYDSTGKDPKRSWLTRDLAIVDAYFKDPKCTCGFTLAAHKGLFEAVQFSCSANGMKKIPANLPMFVISGEEDPVGDLGTGVRKVYEMLRETGHTAVNLLLIPGDRHEVLNEIDHEIADEALLQWMESLIP